jgi:hypothetical protein
MAGKSRFVGKVFLPNCEKHQEKRFYFQFTASAKRFSLLVKEKELSLFDQFIH